MVRTTTSVRTTMTLRFLGRLKAVAWTEVTPPEWGMRKLDDVTRMLLLLLFCFIVPFVVYFPTAPPLAVNNSLFFFCTFDLLIFLWYSYLVVPWFFLYTLYGYIRIYLITSHLLVRNFDNDPPLELVIMLILPIMIMRYDDQREIDMKYLTPL